MFEYQPLNAVLLTAVPTCVCTATAALLYGARACIPLLETGAQPTLYEWLASTITNEGSPGGQVSFFWS